MPRRIARWRKRRQLAERAEAEPAQQPGRQQVGREQAVEAVGQADHQAGIGLAPAVVADQDLAAAEVLPGARGIDQDLGERGDVAHAEIEALGVDRVDRMGGIADQRDARRGEAGARAGRTTDSRSGGRGSRAGAISAPSCSRERLEQLVRLALQQARGGLARARSR